MSLFPVPRVQCFKCKRKVDALQAWHDAGTAEMVYTVHCHGESQLIRVSLEFLKKGPITFGEAFNPKEDGESPYKDPTFEEARARIEERKRLKE